jgi:hypothetical protein
MLQAQLVDGRMDGYSKFKYRVKFESYDFKTKSDDFGDSWDRCSVALLNCCQFMTERYGYGPELSLVRYMTEVPLWAIRSAHSGLNTRKPPAIYLRDDQALEEFNGILAFYQIQGAQ